MSRFATYEGFGGGQLPPMNLTPPVVVVPAIVVVARPAITGILAAGHLLMGVSGGYLNGTVSKREWLLDGQLVQTGLTYMAAGAGSLIYRETVSAAGAADVVSSSDAVSIVVVPKPQVAVAGSIAPSSGTVGTTFTATDPTFTNAYTDGTGVTRQWYVGTTVLGTGTTQLVDQAGTVTCVWVGHGDGGNSDPITSSSATTSLPQITLAGSADFTTTTAAGTQLTTIGNIPVHSTPTVTPNDGRLIILGDAISGWKLAVGTTASSAGNINFTISAAGTADYVGTAHVTVPSTNSREAPVLTVRSDRVVGSNPLAYDAAYGPSTYLGGGDTPVGDYVNRQMSHNSNGSAPYLDQYVQLDSTKIGTGVIDWEAETGQTQQSGYNRPRERLLAKAYRGLNHFFCGDSLTAAGSYWTPFYNEVLAAPFIPGQCVQLVAASGRMIKLNSGFNNVMDHLTEVVAGRPASVMIAIGTNELANFANLYPDLTNQQRVDIWMNIYDTMWMTLRAMLDRAYGTDYQCAFISATLLPRGDGAGTGLPALWNALRAIANPAIRARTGTLVHYCADWASDVDMGADDAPSKAVYWDANNESNLLHPNATGQARMGTYVTPIMHTVRALTDAWAVTGPWSTDDVSDTIEANNVLDTWVNNTQNGASISQDGYTTTNTNYNSNPNAFIINRVNTPILAGQKRIVEVTGATMLGFISADNLLSTNAHFGFDNHSLNWGIAGVIYAGNSQRATLSGAQQVGVNDRMTMLIDRVNHTFSMMKGGVYVLGDPAHQDPADTNNYKGPPIDISFLPEDVPIYAAIEMAYNTPGAVLSKVTTPPAGFSYGA